MTELAAWLRLTSTPGLGPSAVRALLKAFGSPEAVLGASAAALGHVVAGADVAALLEGAAEEAAELAAACDRWLQGGSAADRRGWIALGDGRYPAALLQTADPPLLLFTQGRVELLGRPALAIVGSRNATPSGIGIATAFARHLSGKGWTIVSGLALGIDAAAHQGALDADGSSIAVVGTGLDRVYPARNRALAHRLAAEGLILSEFPIGTPPLPPNFPRRNRIIAGLARGTLVVEAATQSGSLITARLAAEAGREVFAVPGSIHSPQSHGCHRLIREGAKLVETADDILDELAPATARAAPAAPPAEEPFEAASSPDPDEVLLRQLGWDPCTLDALQARTGWPTDRLQARLLELQLQARVSRLPGGLYQRVAHG